MKLTREQLLEAYRRMRTIREFEERAHAEFLNGRIPGLLHLYAGEEATAVGVCMHLKDTDYIGSTHRGHGHCIAKGCHVQGMMLEIFARKDGLCGGKGGSMHIADLSKGMLGANGIVGGSPPLVCGAALTSKVLRSGAVAVAFMGDGASNQGTAFESMNLAMVLRLPAIFVIENNGYGEMTGISYHCGARDKDGKPDLAGRAAGMGMPATSVDGMDFFAVYEAMDDAVRLARSGGGPSTIETRCVRYFGHFVGDPQEYRSKTELEEVRKKDPLENFRKRVTEDNLLNDAELDLVDTEAMRVIEEAVAAAEAAPFPETAELLTDVYVSY
jgi:acetoin:2,6-dichlorophenolindophenol oxidoreductase subunit alpha